MLDEPSSGLDPIARRDILGAVIRTIADEGRTVFFSSHLLDEVERVADHVTMMDERKIVLSAPLAEIKESHRAGGRVPTLDEIFIARVGGHDWAGGGPLPDWLSGPVSRGIDASSEMWAFFASIGSRGSNTGATSLSILVTCGRCSSTSSAGDRREGQPQAVDDSA